ncbi:MAG: hypothetical protein SFZ23_12070 [Planctomycetota bacterium]|nr:hypothetical protein [Planctomycetota bacterium]
MSRKGTSIPPRAMPPRATPQHSRALGACLGVCACGWSALMLAACTERTVYYRPMLGALPGAETQSVVTTPRGYEGDPRLINQTPLRQEAPDGEVTLSAKNIRSLMVHIITLLDPESVDSSPSQAASGDAQAGGSPDLAPSPGEGTERITYAPPRSTPSNADLFVKQVLSERTLREFADRGVDPREAYEFLRENVDDVRALFNALPQGEFTPGIFLRKIGDRTFRLAAAPQLAKKLRYTAMDVVLEGGDYRLRWFVE